MSNKKLNIHICLGSFVYIKSVKNKKKIKTLGYIRAKNADNSYEVVTVLSANTNSALTIKNEELELIQTINVKQALCDAESEFSPDEYQAFVTNYNAFQYKMITIPYPNK